MARSAVVRAVVSMSSMRYGEVRSVDLDAEPEWVRRAAKGLVAIDSADQPAPEPDISGRPGTLDTGPTANVGTVAEVLNRVATADDPIAEAEAALAEEEAKDAPRRTLTAELYRRLADENDDGET